MKLSHKLNNWVLAQGSTIPARFAHFEGSTFQSMVNTRINTLGSIGEQLVQSTYGYDRSKTGQGDFTTDDGKSVEVKTTVSRLNAKGKEYVDFNVTRSVKFEGYDFYVIVVVRPESIETFKIQASSLKYVNRGSTSMITLLYSDLKDLEV